MNARAVPIAVSGAAMPEPVIHAMRRVDIAGWGEATHGNHEFYMIKRQAFQAAVEKADYRVLAIEVPFPSALPLDRYVIGGEGNPRQLVAKLGYPFGEEELLATIRWMRKVNETRGAKRQLRVMGYDMQTPDEAIDAVMSALPEPSRAPFMELQKTMASGSVLDALASVGPPVRHRMLADARRLVIAARSAKLPAELVQAAEVSRQGVEMAVAQAEAYSSLGFRREFELRRRLAASALVLSGSQDFPEDLKEWLSEVSRELGMPAIAAYRAMGTDARAKWRAHVRRLLEWATGKEQQLAAEDIAMFIRVAAEYAEKPARPREVRDPAMAENVRWAHEHVGGKVFVSGHNFHVSVLTTGSVRMGAVLRRSLAGRFLSVGFAFGQGSLNAIDVKTFARREFKLGAPRPGGLDAILAKADSTTYWLDLRNLPTGALKDFLRSPQWKREGGATWEPEREAAAYQQIAISEAFDALVFVRNTTPSKLVSPN